MTRSVAFITNELPVPNVAGHLVYNYKLIRFLEKEGFLVHIILFRPNLPELRLKVSEVFNPRSTTVQGKGLLSINGCCIPITPMAFARNILPKILYLVPKYGRVISLCLRKNSIVMGRFITPKEIAYTTSVIRKLKPAAIFVSTVFCAPLLPHIELPSRKFIVTHDIFCSKVDALRSRGLFAIPDINYEMEAQLLSVFDVIIAIQDDEKAILRKMAPSKAVVTVKYAVDPVRGTTATRVAGRCLFIASRGTFNLDGLQWLVRDVWPRVIREVPDAELHVYGSVCDDMTESYRGVIYHGWTTNLQTAYLTSSVGLVPLRAGSGLKIKLLDYIAHGLPCVITTAGAQGFEPDPVAPFLWADDSEDYARAICCVLADCELRAALSERAYRYCERFSDANVFYSLKSCLRAIA
jgi:polysaccharide biosynthesis protein PslH